MIEIRNFTVSKGGRQICRVEELEIAAGERVGMIGANGSGKTTLLRVLAGFERDFDGTLRIGADTRQRVLVHQSPYLFRGSVMFNVTYGLRGISASEKRRLATKWLATMGLESFADRPSHQLSGGEQRRVALIRAMILRPKLLLLDEPLADMDAAGIAAVQVALDSLDDSTVVIASPTDPPEGLVERVYRL